MVPDDSHFLDMLSSWCSAYRVNTFFSFHQCFVFHDCNVNVRYEFWLVPLALFGFFALTDIPDSILILTLESFKYVHKIFRKTNIPYPLIRTRTCVYQGVRNVSFPESFAYVLNEWSLFLVSFLMTKDQSSWILNSWILRYYWTN